MGGLSEQRRRASAPNVYVQPYPATGGAFQISRDIGFKPLWSSDGKELFFLNDEGLMAVPIDAANGFHAGAPRLLFPVTYAGTRRGSRSTVRRHA